ncbi:hypothetical protein AAFN60_08285 [Roseibacillus persicicus]|uniref:DinB/UmuC family translesion DNA polymerase n=1 Tax=Roseibacillus persicicus TaxID=454148 RepID=UPI00398ABC3B
MFLALHLPALPLRAATWGLPDTWEHPQALSNGHDLASKKSQLTCLNPAAQQWGLFIGIPTPRALARCPTLQILEPKPENEILLRQELLHVARNLSPDLEVTRSDTLLLGWKKNTPPTLSVLTSLPLQQAIAPTPDLAHLSVIAGSDFQNAPLPLLLATFLPPGPEHNDLAHTLASWGLRSINDFTTLPRPDLQERLGGQAALLHDIATGRHHRLLTLYRPPKDYRQHLDLDYPLETLDSLLLLLRRFLHTLAARLQAHQRVPDGLFLTLHFEDHTHHLSTLRIPEPTTDQDQLLRIIETHLNGLTAPAPVIALTLDASATRPSRSQHDLFQKTLRDPNQFAHTLNQLSACLGRDALGVPQATDSFRPDCYQLLPPESLFDRSREKPGDTAAHALLTSTLPLRRLRPPLAVQVLTTPEKTPQVLLDGPYPGPLREVSGPFILQSTWWESAQRWTGHEWDVQLHRGPLSRLTHQPPHHWQIEGYY